MTDKLKMDIATFLTTEGGFTNIIADTRGNVLFTRVGSYYDEIPQPVLKKMESSLNVKVEEVMIDDDDCGLLYSYKIKKNKALSTIKLSGGFTGNGSEYLTHNDCHIDNNRTSYQGEIELDYFDIEGKLGRPENGDAYKIDAHWTVQFEDGTIATLYNWKDGINYCGVDGLHMTQIKTWHIGGLSSDAVDSISELFKVWKG